MAIGMPLFIHNDNARFRVQTCFGLRRASVGGCWFFMPCGVFYLYSCMIVFEQEDIIYDKDMIVLL